MSSLTQQGSARQSGGNTVLPSEHWPGFHSNRSGSKTPRDKTGAADDAVAAGSGGADSHIAVLVRAIEHEVIPRLVRAHRPLDEPPTPLVPSSQAVTEVEVQQFAGQALAGDENLAETCVAIMRTRRIPIETIYLDLLAPVARYLGRQWEEDLCDFTDVTLGLGRLQRVLHELSPAFRRSLHQPGNGLRILLLPSPGEQHTFGLSMVAEFFSRAGWDVAGGAWEAGADPVVMARQEWLDVVGFSLCTELHISELADCIRSIRSSAMNRQVGIMVGGPVVAEKPELVAEVGADAMTSDGRQGPELAEKLVAARSRHAEQRARACQCHP